MALSVSTGPLGVSSTHRGPKLNTLEMQEGRPANPKSINPKFGFGINIFFPRR